jgi:abequosyltransferase
MNVENSKSEKPLISVCIPAYNRASVLSELLESILSQNFMDYEILICEDRSPERDKIRAVVENYCHTHPGRIRYHENANNLGYDGNLRNLIEKANGHFCLFMGNDDLMCPEALMKVASALNRQPNIGVLLRSYATFDGLPTNIIQTYRYFDSELLFPAGAQTISTIYRRAVVIPGMVIQREAALRYATERFDGTLLYQLYLVANILSEMNAVYLPDVIVLYRMGGIPDFGNSPVEKGKFQPKEQTIESSIYFMQGMLDIAKYVEQERNVVIYEAILHDIANYCYPILATQSNKPLIEFFKYSASLAKMGLGRHLMFYFWFLAILLLKPHRIDSIIGSVKRWFGHTPSLGKIYRGEV